MPGKRPRTDATLSFPRSSQRCCPKSNRSQPMTVRWDTPRRRFSTLSIRTAILAFLLTNVIQVAGVEGQSVLQFGKPDAVLTEPFSLIKGVRELTDGRVVLTDWIE